MKRLLFALLLLPIYAVAQVGNNSGITNKDSIKIYSLASGDSITISKNADVEKNRYIIEYGGHLNLDTTFICGDYVVQIINRCDTSRRYLFPMKYVWNADLVGVYIYYSWSEVILKSLSKKATNIVTINENTFSPLLKKDNEQIRQYGVLLGPTIEQIDKTNCKLTIHYNYSIPFTDLGLQAMAIIDFQTNTVSPSIE